MSGFSPQALCDHANECPNSCPCSADCVCRTRMCPPSYSGPVLHSRWMSELMLAAARLDGERAIVAVYEAGTTGSERVCAIVEADGTSVFADEELCRTAMANNLEGFLEEVRALMPAAVVMLT